MEIVLFLLLFWFFSRILRGKKRKGPVDKWEAFEEVARKKEKLQQKYDKYMMSLPELAGDGSYSQPLRGEYAYRETLDSVVEWLDRYHPGKDEVNAIVEVVKSKDGAQSSVRVEAGDAVIGFIPRETAGEFAQELTALGGIARVGAKFDLSRTDGKHSISLDVVRPLRIG
jgi:hypothetical protein